MHTVKHEERLTGSARSIQDKGWNYGKSSKLGAGQPLLSMRLLGLMLLCIRFNSPTARSDERFYPALVT